MLWKCYDRGLEIAAALVRIIQMSAAEIKSTGGKYYISGKFYISLNCTIFQGRQM